MKNQPLVTIVVPSYNLAQLLLETLSSIEAQSYPNWECVVVDDGSTDNTRQIAEEWCSTHEKFSYIYKENGGQASARNAGIRASSGEYILPVDADDKIAKDYVAKCVEVLQSKPQVGIVYCRAQKFRGEKYKEWQLPPYSLSAMLRTNIIFSCGMYRRADYELTRGYNEQRGCMYEDWDFWLSIIELGRQVHCIDEVLFYYRVRKFSFSQRVRGRDKWLAIFMVVSDHLPLYAKHYDDKAIYDIASKLLHNKEFSLGNSIYGALRNIKNLIK